MARLLKVIPALLLALVAAWGRAQTVGGLSFTTPPGWTYGVQDGVATFTPAGGAAQGLMLLLPGQQVSGDPAAWFAARVGELSADSQVLDRSEVQVGRAASGPSLLLQGVTVRLGGREQQRFYLAAVSGNQAALAVLIQPVGAGAGPLQSGLFPLVDSVRLPGPVASAGGAGSGSPFGSPAALPAVKPQNAAQFVAAGGNPERQVIPDEFRCYLERRGSGLTPELTVQILPGGKYRTAYGAGTFSVKRDGGLDKTAWRGGPLDGAYGYLIFDDYGQRLSLSNVGEDRLESSLSFECYQRGPMEDLKLLQFRLRTPAPASYPCLLLDGSGKSGGTLDILPGGAYRLGGQSGRYSVDFRSDQNHDWSDLEFTGGPLDDTRGTYQEDEVGVRELRVFGPSMRCRVVTKPTPIPRYGAVKAPLPPKGSGGLTGAYAAWSPDSLAVLGYGGCGGLCWDFRIFTKEGYVYTGEPEGNLGDADCSRTHPNGLPVCEVYRVQGGQITVGGDEPQPLVKDGRNLQIGGRAYEPMLPLTGVKLNAVYESQSFIGGGVGSTVSGGFQRTLAFTPQGRFSREASGGVSATFTDTGNSFGNVTGGFASSSQDSSAGTYRFADYTLELTYGDGHVERKFAFALPDKNGKPDLGLLRIGGSTYTRQDGK